MNPADIKIEVAPPNGRPQRLVIAKHQDRELHRDSVNIDSRRGRKSFSKEIAAKVKLKPQVIDEVLEPLIVAAAEAADAEADAAAEELRNAKRQGYIGDSSLPEILLPGQASTITEAAGKLGKLLAATGEFYNRGGAGRTSFGGLTATNCHSTGRHLKIKTKCLFLL
jgi:hypothetical protein